MADEQMTGTTQTTSEPAGTAVTARHGAGIDRTEEWAQLRARHLRARGERPTSAARGVHHVALLSSDVERTIAFYQDLLELPLTEVFENRDYQGSTHFFFDIGNGNALAFFDFPGLDLGPYAERLGVPVHEEGGTSLYFPGPDGERIELIADPLGEMYGSPVV
jgi:catechol 2,3-dioxygenase-like lactoylglutathione lyase family enzyme